MYFYRKDKRQTALFKEKVIALYELLFVMMRVALESTFQLHADKMKMRKWKSDCTMSRKTKARACSLDMRRATRDTRNESRATGDAPRAIPKHRACICTYARMHVSRAHAFVRAYLQRCTWHHLQRPRNDHEASPMVHDAASRARVAEHATHRSLVHFFAHNWQQGAPSGTLCSQRLTSEPEATQRPAQHAAQQVRNQLRYREVR